MVSAYQSLLSVPPEVPDQACWAPTPICTATVPGMVTPVTSYPAPCRPISMNVCGAEYWACGPPSSSGAPSLVRRPDRTTALECHRLPWATRATARLVARCWCSTLASSPRLTRADRRGCAAGAAAAGVTVRYVLAGLAGMVVGALGSLSQCVSAKTSAAAPGPSAAVQLASWLALFTSSPPKLPY